MFTIIKFFLKISIKVNKRFVHTITETITSPSPQEETIKNVQEVPKTIVETEVSTPVSIDQLKQTIANNNAKLDAILQRSSEPRSSSIPKTESVDTESSSSSQNNEDLQKIIGKIEKPSTQISVGENDIPLGKCMTSIKATSKLMGHKLSEKIAEQNITLTQTKQAEKRQEALYQRIQEFIASFGVRRTITTIGLGLATIYTIYHLLRYREIPLGGFIKGFFTNSSLPSNTGDISSHMIGPTNNITIALPSNETLKTIKEVSLGSSIGNIINSLGPQSLAIIGVVIWILKKR